MAYDKIIIGAGLYGLYAARHCGRKGERVLVVEKDETPFRRATTINQARVHMGYHYPRSISTALRSAGYFERFVRDFSACIVDDFEQVYATSTQLSWTNAQEFRRFCAAADIRCDDVSAEKYFKPGLCDGAYTTREYSYDAALLLQQMKADLTELSGVEIRYGAGVQTIEKAGGVYRVACADDRTEETPYLLNATYSGANEILAKLSLEPFRIKYELCEIILCKVSDALRGVGITVMDGPFFSIMPFGRTGMHSLTSVTFTPHITSYDVLPTFGCQQRTDSVCTPQDLRNCNDCPQKPASAWPAMSQLARKYLKDEYGFIYERSLFSMKPVLKASEIDDSRPTLVRVMSDTPTFVSVLSGKINTVYDLEEVL